MDTRKRFLVEKPAIICRLLIALIWLHWQRKKKLGAEIYEKRMECKKTTYYRGNSTCYNRNINIMSFG